MVVPPLGYTNAVEAKEGSHRETRPLRRLGGRSRLFRVAQSLPVQIIWAVVFAVYVVKAATDDGTFDNPALAVAVFGFVLAAVILEIALEVRHRRRVKQGRSRRPRAPHPR